MNEIRVQEVLQEVHTTGRRRHSADNVGSPGIDEVSSECIIAISMFQRTTNNTLKTAHEPLMIHK